MLRIGLTGGIGSGKSTVAAIFEVLGIPVLYADSVAKKLMIEDVALITSIKSTFGESAYSQGILNREFLAQKIFNDEKQLQLLNAIVHPATINYAAQWMQKQNAPYIIKEAALIFESGSEKNLDYIIGVKAPLGLRISRVMQRDNISKEEVEARISKQIDEEKKLALCDFIIVNDEQQLVTPQVLALHAELIKLNG